MDEARKLHRTDLLHLLTAVAVVLTYFGALDRLDSYKNVPDSHSKTMVNCFEDLNPQMVSAINDVSSKLNSICHVEETEYCEDTFLTDHFLQNMLFGKMTYAVMIISLILAFVVVGGGMFMSTDKKQNQNVIEEITNDAMPLLPDEQLNSTESNVVREQGLAITV